MPLYLADTSIWAWANKNSRPDITEKLATRLERDEVATCAPVALEVMHRAATGDQYEALFASLLKPIRWLELGQRVSQRALQVQRELAARSHGNHRRPAIDYLIAAVGELAGDDVVTWFFDKDFRVICEHTGQRFEAESTTGPGQ
ncbi:MAG: PIN domain-containing protein [Mycobacteriales bacterium]